MAKDNTIKEWNMKELAAYQQELFVKPKLTFLFFELTDKCNLTCLHCGSSCTNRNDTFLSFAAIKRTLESVARAYNPKEIMICLTGGEPLLYPKLLQVIALSKYLGFAVGITTNGTLITKEYATLLKKVGLDTISVSIDGIGDRHDCFRQQKGSFDRAIAGIHNLKAAGIEPEVISVIHKDSISDLDKLYKFISVENIYTWRVVNIDPIGRAKESHLLLDAQELKQLYEFIRKKRQDPNVKVEINYGCSHFVTYEYEREIRDYYFQCGAGTKVASIMANGDIGACLDIERRPELIQGNIYYDDFISVWENKYTAFRFNRASRSTFCARCKYKGICMGDSTHTWDFDDNKPLYCINDLFKKEKDGKNEQTI